MPKNDDIKKTSKNLENENKEEEEKKITKPEQELFEALTNVFLEYYKKNKDKFKNMTIEEIYFEFLKQEGNEDKNNIIEQLESILGRNINFSDIKNFYLKSGYTLGSYLIKDMFKKFKEKNAIKSIIRKFQEKINKELQTLTSLNIDFEQFLKADIKNEDNIDNLYEQIITEYYKIIQRIKEFSKKIINKDEKEQYNNLLNKLKNIKITNEEIINQMLQDGLINQEEFKTLTEKDISTLNSKASEKLYDIFSNLFNTSILGSIQEYLNIIDKIKLDFENFKDIGSIYNAVKPFLNLKQSEIDEIYNDKIKDNLSEYEQEKLNRCGELNGEASINCENNIKKKLVEKYLKDNLDELANIIDEKDKVLAQIIRKININKTLKNNSLIKDLLDLLNNKNNKNNKDFEKTFNNLLENIKSNYQNTQNIIPIIKDIKKIINDNEKQAILDTIVNILSKTDETERNNLISSLKSKNLNIEELTKLNNNEKWHLFDKIKENYIQNILNFIVPALKLTDSQKSEYIRTLNSLFSKDKGFAIYKDGTEIKFDNIEKEIELASNITDLHSESPRFKLTIKNNDVDFFKSIFGKYFWHIKTGNIDKSISTFSKVKIKTKNNQEIQGYIQQDPDGNIEVYNHYDDSEPKTIIKKDDLKSIDEIDKQLILENADLPELLFALAGSVNGQGQLEQGANKLLQEGFNIEKDLNSKTEEEKQEKLKKFHQEWKKFDGDDSLNKVEKGNIILVKGKSLNIPGLLNNWYYGEITDINEKKGTFKLKIGGGVLDFEGGAIEKELPLSADILKNIKYSYYGNAFRFKKINNIDEFANYINDLKLTSNFQGFERSLNKWQQAEIKVENGKLMKKQENGKYEEIKYIGRNKVFSINNKDAIKNAKHRSDLYDVWQVEFKDNKVVLKDPDGNFSKTVDLNTFMGIFLHNNLSPWTEKDYRTIKLNYENVLPQDKSPLSFIKLFAINDFSLAFKHIKDSFLYYFKEDDELRAAIMYEKLSAFLPSFWFFKDIKLEAGGEKEARIWKIIENAKARLERSGEGKGDNHGKVASNIIYDEVFKPILDGKKLSSRQKRKAAGYLLYALDKGPGAYFRKLADHAGEGIWIKALLGYDEYYKWHNQVQTLKQRLKENPNDNNARSDLVLSEMFYLKDDPLTADLYTAKFGPTVEGLAIAVTGDSGKADKAYEQEAEKGSFQRIQEGLLSYIKNERVPNAMGSLEAIAETVDSTGEYVHFNKLINTFIFTGFVFNKFGEPYRMRFDKICRTYSIPIGHFAKQANGVNKVLRIFDYIVRKNNIHPGGKKQSFTEYLYGVSDPDKIDITEYNNKKKIGPIISKIENFWNEYGEDITLALDYTNPILLDFENDKKISDKEKAVIGEYIETVNIAYKGENWEVSKKFSTSYAPYYKEGIFNTSASAFKKYALKIDDGSFEDPVGAGMWEGLTWKLQTFSDFVEKDSIYKFILKRFVSWFGGYYKRNDKIKLIQALRNGKKEELDNIIYNHLKHSLGGHYGDIPAQVEDGLEEFVNILSIRPANINNIIESIFEKNLIEKSYHISTPNIENLQTLNNTDYNKDYQQAA